MPNRGLLLGQGCQKHGCGNTWLFGGVSSALMSGFRGSVGGSAQAMTEHTPTRPFAESQFLLRTSTLWTWGLSRDRLRLPPGPQRRLPPFCQMGQEHSPDRGWGRTGRSGRWIKAEGVGSVQGLWERQGSGCLPTGTTQHSNCTGQPRPAQQQGGRQRESPAGRDRLPACRKDITLQ